MTTKPYSTDETSRSEGVLEPIVSYYPFYPSTKEELMQELAEAEDDFLHGRVYSSDDLRKESLLSGIAGKTLLV